LSKLKTGDVTVALGVAVVGGNSSEAIDEIFDARVRRGDMILAKLTKNRSFSYPAGQ